MAGNTNDDDEELKEQQHFQHVIDTFMYYKSSSQKRVQRKIKAFETLSKKQQDMIPTLKIRLERALKAVDINFEFIKNIVFCADEMFVNSDMKNGINQGDSEPITKDDIDRVLSTLSQCVRDWSSDGEEERKMCYEPIINELSELYPTDVFDRKKINVLIPGAGLGRLLFDISQNGFNCHGNEFSLYMLFASNFILNYCPKVGCVTVFPWIHHTSNVLSNDDQMREVKLPDVNTQEMDGERISMGAGDFLEVYTKPNCWDCIAMSFFLDTAHNVIEYIEKVWQILKPGGYWINFGPLLYHFADVADQFSIELTYDELRKVILEDFKFKLIKEQTGVKATYVQNKESMLKTEFECIFFVVQKPLLV